MASDAEQQVGFGFLGKKSQTINLRGGDRNSAAPPGGCQEISRLPTCQQPLLCSDSLTVSKTYRRLGIFLMMNASPRLLILPIIIWLAA